MCKQLVAISIVACLVFGCLASQLEICDGKSCLYGKDFVAHCGPQENSSSVSPDTVNETDLEVVKAIQQTAPNIPIEYANKLVHVSPSLLRYILDYHEDVEELIMAMSARTMEYAAKHAKRFQQYLSYLDVDELTEIFDKFTDECQFIGSLKVGWARAIAYKVPRLRKCIDYPEPSFNTKPRPVVDLYSPEVEHDKSSTREGAKSESMDEFEPEILSIETIFSPADIEKMRTKVPKIMELLKNGDVRKLKAMVTVFPDFTEHFVKMDPEVFKLINRVKLEKNRAEPIYRILSEYAKNSFFIRTLATAFKGWH